MQKNGTKILIIVLLILIVISGTILALKIIEDNNIRQNKISSSKNKSEYGNEEIEDGKGKNGNKSGEKILNNEEDGEIKQSNSKIKIFSGLERPIAVMIDNSKEAWPQAGLNDAYMVYEIAVEGGETRLMALLKGKEIDKIGPVRSSRHYFLDYAMENDAIYVHYGWSPMAETDISKYKINNINGITEGNGTFWRVNDKLSPHNAVTSTEKILESAKEKNYRTTSNRNSVLNYSAEEINLEDGIDAKNVIIPHSALQKVEYEYDEENKVYKRFARNKAQTEWTSKEAVTTKNIIITFCDNVAIQGDTSGRQDLKNIGTFDGYYITNGKAIKIKCIKNARDKQTVYKDLAGNTIKVNDGNTFVNICPMDAKVTLN